MEYKSVAKPDAVSDPIAVMITTQNGEVARRAPRETHRNASANVCVEFGQRNSTQFTASFTFSST
jgi:hypothetical protein